MRIRHSSRAPRAAAVTSATAALLVVALGTPAAHADVLPSIQTATVTVSSTMSYTATTTQPVTATASWGAPAITKTLDATLTATNTQSATRSATVTQTATADTAVAALSAATATAKFLATLQSQIDALTAASISATTLASHSLIPLVTPKKMALYNQALAQAKAAVIARDGKPTGAPDACGAAQFKSDETRWTCTFDDEFTGTKLNSAKWTTWNGVNYWSDPNVCFYNDPSHVSVSGGALKLSVTRMSPATRCQTMTGTTEPAYGAGLVHTKGKFSQTYGQFQARIKFAGGYGIHNDFWLFPTDVTPGDHAEIDVAEPIGSAPNTMYSVLHRTLPGASDELGTTSSCSMKNWAGSYHTYGLVWTPTDLQFSYDGTVCSIAPNTGEYARNFYAILEVLADGGSVGPNSTTALPATMSVDWMRVWK